jgi:hypothetical protein
MYKSKEFIDNIKRLLLLQQVENIIKVDFFYQKIFLLNSTIFSLCKKFVFIARIKGYLARLVGRLNVGRRRVIVHKNRFRICV